MAGPTAGDLQVQVGQRCPLLRSKCIYPRGGPQHKSPIAIRQPIECSLELLWSDHEGAIRSHFVKLLSEPADSPLSAGSHGLDNLGRSDQRR
jgi:hypothetical protein